MLMWTSNDALGMELVRVGAATKFFIKRFRKRALAMVAVHSCYRIMEATVARDFPDQKFIDRSFRPAALPLSGDIQVLDMLGALRRVDDVIATRTWCVL